MEGEGGQVKGINPSSALPSTVMVDGVLYRFTLRSCESTIKLTDPKAPKSSLYVDLSLYPPSTVIENELHWDGSRVVSKVPIWAHEKWLRKYQNAGDPDGGTITPDEDTEILRDDPSYAPAIADAGGKRPCEDRPSFVSATAVASASPSPSVLPPHIREACAKYCSYLASKQGAEALKRPCEDFVEDHPSPTAAAHGGKRPCEDHPNAASATAATSGAKTEVGGLNSSASAYADPSAYGSEDYPGRYLLIVKDGGRIVGKVDTLGLSGPPKVKGGVYYPGQVPRVLKADKSSGNPAYMHPC